MKVTNYNFPKSSFLSIDKDINTILDLLMKNQNLLRLLKYTTDEPFEVNSLQPDITLDEAWDMVTKEIKIVPKVYVDHSVMNYIVISFDNFTPNLKNPHYRDNILSIDIICHYDMWQMKGKYSSLRPYRIAGEIDSMLNEAQLSGIGKLEFLGANQMILNDEFAGISLMYSAIHGDDDTKPGAQSSNGQYIPDEDYAIPPLEELIINNFNKMNNQ